MSDILYRITASKRKRLTEEKAAISMRQLEKMAQEQPPARDFYSALNTPGMHIIAEMKRASPSKGALNLNLDPSTLARAYVDGGASAISVLTEEDHFRGSLADLTAVCRSIHVPTLRKDFLFEPYQVVQTRAHGADTFLLIAGFLNVTALKELIALGRNLGMEPLVESHNESDLDCALAAGARVLGFNNRNLKTFDVSLDTTAQLVKRVPQEYICVSESGIRNRGDVERIEQMGAKGCLIGETLVTSADPAAEIRKLKGVL